jgi:hypothetical protein
LVEALRRFTYDDADSTDAGRLEQLYQRLARDERFLVSVEAAHELALLKHGWQGQILPGREYRRLNKQLQRARPRLTFSGFQTLASVYLRAAGKLDYDLTMLDQFARYLFDHPIDASRDSIAFEVWRSTDRQHARE